jgi:serine/threonine protein kinase
LVFVVCVAVQRYTQDLREKELGRQMLTTQERDILTAAMKGSARNDTSKRGVDSLTQVLLDSKTLRVHKKIGSGAMGDVFQGTCLGQPVAVKTIKKVNKDSIRAFRAEIVLTSTVRHPNVVSFIGACWGADITCLVLEWLPKGSLGSFLEVDEGLSWNAVLLKLVADVVRGMIYLHAREYYDEETGEEMKCIIHRCCFLCFF